MKCDKFLSWLESESFVRAALARQHARHCESCRAAARMLYEVKQELATSDPLPDRLKHIFATVEVTNAVSLPSPVVDHRARAGLWLAALAAAVLIATLPWLFSLKRHDDVAAEVRPHNSAQLAEERRVGPITIFTVDSAQDLNQLEADLAVLKTQLAVATADVQRLSVEEELARVLVDYRRLFAGIEAR